MHQMYREECGTFCCMVSTARVTASWTLYSFFTMLVTVLVMAVFTYKWRMKKNINLNIKGKKWCLNEFPKFTGIHEKSTVEPRFYVTGFVQYSAFYVISSQSQRIPNVKIYPILCFMRVFCLPSQTKNVKWGFHCI